MIPSQETCLELNSSFSGKNDDCSGVALFMNETEPVCLRIERGRFL